MPTGKARAAFLDQGFGFWEAWSVIKNGRV